MTAIAITVPLTIYAVVWADGWGHWSIESMHLSRETAQAIVDADQKRCDEHGGKTPLAIEDYEVGP